MSTKEKIYQLISGFSEEQLNSPDEEKYDKISIEDFANELGIKLE